MEWYKVKPWTEWLIAAGAYPYLCSMAWTWAARSENKRTNQEATATL